MLPVSSRICVAILILVGLVPTVAQAVPSQQISVQGVLRGATGALVEGPVLVNFRLYSDADGTDELWNETQMLDVSYGVFQSSLPLNPGTDVFPVGIFDVGEPRWLGIQASGEPELPLVPLRAVPFAMHAIAANVAYGLDCDECITSEMFSNEAIQQLAEVIAPKQGPVGPQGDVGPQGEVGPQGVQGPIGQKGPQGSIGKTGPQGPKGDVGPQGKKGATGAAGEQGAKGEPGQKGEKGEAGNVGPKGAKGDVGPQGKKGAKGDPGAAGPKGEKGNAGQKGSQGPAGPKGAQGPAGPGASAGTGLSKQGNALSLNTGFTDARYLKTSGGTVSGSLTVNNNLTVKGFTLVHKGADFVIQHSPRGSGGRAVVHDNGDVLVLNFDGDFSGGTRVDSDLDVKGRIKNSCEHKTCSGGDWVTCSCPSGKFIQSGGCDAHTSPHRLQMSAPISSTKWRCGGHGGSKKVYLICCKQW